MPACAGSNPLRRLVSLCLARVSAYGGLRHLNAWFHRVAAMPRKPAAPPAKARSGETSDGTRDRVPSSATAPEKAPRPRSLMKTSALPGRRTAAPQPVLRRNGGARRATARRTAAAGDQSAKIEERIGAASEQLASGIGQAAAAAEELRRAIDQIVSTAEEAASASHQTLAVATSTTQSLARTREQADTTRRRTESLHLLLGDTASQISVWAANIKQNGERQAGSVAVIAQLSGQAASIGDVTRTVSA